MRRFRTQYRGKVLANFIGNVQKSVIVEPVGHIYVFTSQEISDFTQLVNECGYSTLEAILYNVLSGLSVIFGGIAITAADIEDHVVGMLLAYGGGAIVYVACMDLYPHAEEAKLETDPHAFSKRVLADSESPTTAVYLLTWHHLHEDLGQ